jgi:hypothetical protein
MAPVPRGLKARHRKEQFIGLIVGDFAPAQIEQAIRRRSPTGRMPNMAWATMGIILVGLSSFRLRTVAKEGVPVRFAVVVLCLAAWTALLLIPGARGQLLN